MSVPYIFASLPNGTAIPLSYLDADFAYLSTSPTFTGNVTITGTLGVGGAVTFNSTLNVSGLTTLSTLGVTGTATFGTQQSVQGSIVLANTAAGAYPTTIKSSNSSTTAWTFTLPTTAGTNGYVLSTNGSGVSSWVSPTSLGIDLDVGSTAITAGTSGRVLYDNAGVLGEYPITGTAGSVVLSTSPTITTPTTSGNVTATGSAARFLADFSNATVTNQFGFQTSTTNGSTGIYALPNGSSTAASWQATNLADPTNASKILIATNGVTDVQLVSGINGTGTYLPLSIYTGGAVSAQFSTTPGTFGIGVAGTSQGILNLNGATSGTVSVKGAAAAGTWTMTLPATGGTNNYVLTTNGSGVTSWSQVSLTAGVTGVLPVANGGTNASSAGITAFNNITGYTASGATGTTSTNLVFSTSPTLTGAIIAAGTASVAPVTLTSGTNLTSAAAGANEYDGTNRYFTIDTTSGRGITPTTQLFRLTANGSNITTIADYFGTNSAITMVSGGVYEIEWTVYFTQNTGAGTVTFTIASSQAPVYLSAFYNGSPVGGIATVGAPQFAALQGSTSTTAALPVTGSLSAATHQYTIKAIVESYASGTSTIRLRATSSANSITPLRDSYYKVTRLSSGNTGTFVA